MHVFITCKNEGDSIKMKALERPQHISFCKSMGIFPNAEGQLTPQLVVSLAKNRTLSTVYSCSCYPKEWRKFDQTWGRYSGHKSSPIVTLWKLSVSMETRVLIRSLPNAAFTPYPNDASVKIWLRSSHTGCGDIHVWKCGRTLIQKQTLTNRRRLDWYILWPQVS